MVALNSTGRADLTPVVQKARTFVAAGQHFGGDEYDGGMGYDAESGQAYADLSNSYVAYEAMRLTQNVEELRKSGDKRADLDWAAAQKFITSIQNNKPGDAPAEKGGFGYTPNESKAGTYTNADGIVRFRSYGSMTYAGLLSFIYADAKKDDGRVTSAFEWANKHWTLDENPGMGAQGHYYFINVLSKALAAFGQDIIALPDGKKINWREEVINKLINLQKIENGRGYWINDAGRWMEADPILTTSYCIVALDIARGSK
jgi:squalene-hopene/tetraprenyl-beta-curcumene cyclase